MKIGQKIHWVEDDIKGILIKKHNYETNVDNEIEYCVLLTFRDLADAEHEIGMEITSLWYWIGTGRIKFIEEKV